MKLSHEDYDQLTVMSVKGDLTSERTEEFRKAITDRLEAKIRDFVLDLKGMEFVDSKGLESLLWAQEQCGERLGQVRLAAATDSVAKILEITRLAPRFDCHPDVDSAIKSLR
jgi:stage II sporulation protein AA (anti-sigma F factor antagonist)